MSIAEEREAALSARMEFLQISVPARTLPDEQLDIFRRELAALPKPAYVHCTCGGRALLFGAVHLGIEVDEPEDAILTRIQGRGMMMIPPSMIERSANTCSGRESHSAGSSK